MPYPAMYRLLVMILLAWTETAVHAQLAVVELVEAIQQQEAVEPERAVLLAQLALDEEVVERREGAEVVVLNAVRDEAVVADVAVEVVLPAADAAAADDEATEEEAAEEAEEEAEARDAGQAFGRAFGGLIQGFLGRPQPTRRVSNAAVNKDVDGIESVAKLRSLKRQLEQHPQLRHVIGQVETQMDALRDNEMRLLHYACNLRRSEFNRIVQNAERVKLKAVIKVYQAMASGNSSGKDRSCDPQTAFARELLVVAEQELGKRADAYREEIETRALFRQEAMVQSMTASLDAQLLCSASQREAINAVFHKHWRQQWLMAVQYLDGNGLRYFPDIPKQAIRDVLNEVQREVFGGLQWQPQSTLFLNDNGLGVIGEVNKKLEDDLEFAPEAEALGKEQPASEAAE